MTLQATHPDHALLHGIATEILKRAGGQARLAAWLPQMLRSRIDHVINTPETNRRSFIELEKTEKTYIGTLVEIALRRHLKLPKGKKLDLLVAGHEVDIKMTVGGTWMLPREVMGSPALLVKASEVKAICSLGLVVCHTHYMRPGRNQDRKGSLAAASHCHIWWLLQDVPYPPNFWRTIDTDVVERIFGAKSGNARMVALFKELPGRPISREVVDAVAQQKDFTRRVRADGKRGTRGILAAQGYLLLSGTYDSLLITQLGLPAIGRSEYVSHKLRDQGDRLLARGAGYPI